jgi:hypothetical protein
MALDSVKRWSVMREPQEIEDEEHEQVLARVSAIDLVEPASNGRRACGIPAQRRTLTRPGSAEPHGFPAA